MALTRTSGTASDEWRSVLVTLGQEEEYSQRNKEFTCALVTNFVLRDKDNAGSVLRMVENARTNARMVRTAITREVWEATNEAWMVLRDVLARPVREGNLGEVLTMIRRQAMLVRGAMEGTMLRNEIFNFARIGAYLEAADNTARIPRRQISRTAALGGLGRLASRPCPVGNAAALGRGRARVPLAQCRHAQPPGDRRIPDPGRALSAQHGLFLRQDRQQHERVVARIRRRGIGRMACCTMPLPGCAVPISRQFSISACTSS